MFENLKAEAIKEFHQSVLENKTWPKDLALEKFTELVWKHIQLNHRYNSLLWSEEDLARRTNVSDAAIVQNKRNIDRYNQLRNNAIERIDEAILAQIPSSHALQENAWINSETAGSIIDRMSIIALRHFNMNGSIKDDKISPEVRNEYSEKLPILCKQWEHLTFCLDQLLNAVANGTATFRPIKQLKMYNDSRLFK